MLRISLFIFLISVFSCGLKTDIDLSDNFFLGSWEMKEVTCSLPGSDSAFSEKYDLTKNLDLKVQASFKNFQFEYSVTSNDCTSTASAIYNADFNGSGRGKISFFDVSSSGTCNVTVAFDGDGVPGATSDINFAMLPPDAKDLNWELIREVGEKDIVSVDLFTGYRGSLGASFCSQNCKCVALFEQD